MKSFTVLVFGMTFFLCLGLAEPKGCELDTVPVSVYSGNLSYTGTQPAEKMKTLADNAVKSLKDAPDAMLYVLPELILTPNPVDKDDFNDVKEASPYAYRAPPLHQIPVTDPFEQFAKVAKDRKAFIQFGFLEKGTGDDEGKLYNSALVIGPDGRVKAKHRKVNLVNTKFANESKYITAGNSATTFDASSVSLGTVGIAICADIYDTADINDEENKSLKEMNLAIEAYEKNPTPKEREKILALVEKIKEISLRAPAHLIEKYRGANVDLLAVSAHWLEKEDSEEGFTYKWTPKEFFQNTAKYLNHPNRESSLSRYPMKMPEGFLSGIDYKQRKDRNVYVAFSNMVSMAPTVGIYGPGGRYLVQRKTTQEGWVVGCVPSVKSQKVEIPKPHELNNHGLRPR